MFVVDVLRKIFLLIAIVKFSHFSHVRGTQVLSLADHRARLLRHDRVQAVLAEVFRIVVHHRIVVVRLV